MATPPRRDESPDPLNDLVKRAQAGDQWAFEQLVRRLDGGLKRILLRRAGGRTEVAEEIAQRTWTAAWEALVRRRYDPRKAAISTFVYAVAHKLWLQHVRRAGNEPTQPAAALLSLPGPTDDPEAVMLNAEIVDALRACLHAEDAFYGLTPEERQVVTGLASGQTERALAEQLGMAASTIHARKQSGYRKLRRCMAAKGFSAEVAERGSTGGEQQERP